MEEGTHLREAIKISKGGICLNQSLNQLLHNLCIRRVNKVSKNALT